MAATAAGRVVYVPLDAETGLIVEALKPLLKAQIRHARTTLAYLTELDARLVDASPDTHSPKEAQRNGSNTQDP